MHELKLSQMQSKWLVEAIRTELSLTIKDKLSFASMTPRQISDKLAKTFGVAVDETWIMVNARMRLVKVEQ